MSRKSAQVIHSNQRSAYPEGRKYGTVFAAGIYSPQYRLCSQHNFPAKGYLLFSPYRFKGVFYKTGFSRKCSMVPAYNTIAHHTQIAWKRLSQGSSHNSLTFSPISRVAQAVSLALSRSFVILPAMVALTCGDVAWAQSSSDIEIFQPRNSFYMRAEDGHAFFTSFLLAILEGVILLIRAIYLTILFTPSIVTAPFVDRLGADFRKIWLQLVHHTLERAGPAFIKWGQWAATRPDLFPRDLCNELAKLHTKAPEHSFAYTKKTIERAFGRKLSEIFDNFEEAPVASGSIAQVH